MALPVQGMRGRVLGAFVWNIGSQFVRQLTRLAYGIAIARLLTPREYGLAGMALAFASLGIVFSDLGFGAALIQRLDVTERDRSTVFWTSVGAGTLLTVAAFFLAGPVARFYGQPSVKPLFQVLSLGFVIGALGMTQASILQRELDFRSLELRIMVGVFAGAVVAVALAAAGFGAWALIANELTVAVLSTSLLWVFSSWRPRREFSMDTIRDFGPFSANLVGKSFLDYAGRNSDNILVGRFLGSAPLGAYAAAYNIMLMPIRNIVQPIQETLFPALSRIQEDLGRLADVWIRATRMLMALVVPAMLGLIVVAPDLVPTLLGQRWHRAIPVLQILAGVAVLQTASALGAKVLTALGRARTLFRYSVVFYATCLPAFALGLRWGIVGVAACYAVVNVPLQWALVRLTTRSLAVTQGAFLRALLGVTVASAGMIACVAALRVVLVQYTGVTPALRLLFVIAVGIATYVPLLARFAPELLVELRTMIRERLRSGSPELPTSAGVPSGSC